MGTRVRLLLMSFLILTCSGLAHSSEVTIPSSHGINAGKVPATSTQTVDCPTQIFQQIRNNDRNGGWLGLFSGITTSEACANHVRSHLDSPSELEQVLANNQTLSLGAERPEGYLDACLADYTKRNPKCRGPNCDKNMSVEQQSAAIADYYYLMNRMRMSSVSNLETIAGIDRMLGTPYLQGVDPISNRDMPAAGDAYSELTSNPNCRKTNTSEIDTLTEQTSQALQILKVTEEKIKANQTYVDPECPKIKRRHYACKTKVRDEVLEQQLQGIKAGLFRSFPWLQSEGFAPILSRQHPNKRNARGGQGTGLDTSKDYWDPAALKHRLVEHFTNTRKALVTQNNNLIEASRCIHGKDGNNCMRSHLETFAGTPELDIPSMLRSTTQSRDENGNWDKKTFSALAELDTGPCRQGIREAKRDMAHVMNDFVLNVGLTAVTFGASAYATAALKTAQVAGNAAKGAKAVNALSQASKLPKAARLAVFISVGADAAWLGPSGTEVLNQCTGEAEQKIAADYRDTSVDGKVSCSNDPALQVSAVSESRNCFMAAALAAMDALPLIPPLAARFSKAGRAVASGASSPASRLAPKTTQELADQVKKIEQMTPAQKEVYAKELLESYPSLTKAPGSNELLSPKNTAEVLLATAWNSGKRIDDVVASGGNARQAFVDNFNSVKGHLASSPKHGKYSADDVLGVSDELQSFLKAEGYKGDVTLSGSFVNGFARQADGSDIDLLTSMNMPIELRDKAAKHLQNYVDKTLPDMKLKVDAGFDVMTEGERLNNGVMLEVNGRGQSLVTNPGGYSTDSAGRVANANRSGRYAIATAPSSPAPSSLRYIPTDRTGEVAEATVDQAGTTLKNEEALDMNTLEAGSYPYLIDSAGNLTLANRFSATGGEKNITHATEQLQSHGVDTQSVTRVDFSKKQPPTHGSELAIAQAIRAVKRDPALAADVKTLQSLHASILERYPQLRGANGALDTNKLSELPEIAQKMDDDSLDYLQEFVTHKHFFDMMSESGAEYAVASSRQLDVNAAKEFFERELKFKPTRNADTVASAATGASKNTPPVVTEANGLKHLSDNPQWRETLPTNVRHTTETRLSILEQAGGRVEFHTGGSHFTVDANGLPVLKISEAHRANPEKLAQIVTHEVDHFMRYERWVKRAAKGSTDPAVLAATRKRLPQSGNSKLIGNLEEGATAIEKEALRHSDEASRLRVAELDAAMASASLDNMDDWGRMWGERERILGSLKQNAAYTRRLDLYPNQETLRRLVYDETTDSATRLRRMDASMDDVVTKIFESHGAFPSNRKLTAKEIYQSFEENFVYLNKKTDPSKLRSDRGLSDVDFAELRRLFFVRASTKYRNNLDDEAIRWALSVRQTARRPAGASTPTPKNTSTDTTARSLERSPEHPFVQQYENAPKDYWKEADFAEAMRLQEIALQTPVVTAGNSPRSFLERVKNTFGSGASQNLSALDSSNLQRIQSFTRTPGTQNEWLVRTQSGNMNDGARIRDEFLGDMSQAQPYHSRLFRKGKVTGYTDGTKGWRYDVGRMDGIPHINVWRTVDGVGQNIRIDLENMPENEIMRVINSLDSRY